MHSERGELQQRMQMFQRREEHRAFEEEKRRKEREATKKTGDISSDEVA